MKVYCPSCSELLPADHVALDKGWAKCDRCNEVFALAGLLPGFPGSTEAKAIRVERPFNARAMVDRTPSDLAIYVPARGLRGGTIAMLGFAVVWLAFVGFWTWAALGMFGNGRPQPMNIAFASFSIPFWLIGLGMLGAVAWVAFGRKTAYLSSSEAVLESRCPWWRRVRRFAIEQVQGAQPYRPNLRHNSQQVLYGAEIVYEKGSFVLTADSENEQNWLIQEINEFLQSVRT